MEYTKATRLAYDIADALNDRDATSLYISYARKYPESFLKKTLQKVLSIPDNKIRKTRGALFTYLVQQHGQRSLYDSGN